MISVNRGFELFCSTLINFAVLTSIFDVSFFREILLVVTQIFLTLFFRFLFSYFDKTKNKQK